MADSKPVKVNSGIKLLRLLAESGTGQAKLDVGYSVFPRDKNGNISKDVHADDVLEALEAASLESETTDGYPITPAVPLGTLEKARQIAATGSVVAANKAAPSLDDLEEFPDEEVETPAPKAKKGSKTPEPKKEIVVDEETKRNEEIHEGIKRDAQARLNLADPNAKTGKVEDPKVTQNKLEATETVHTEPKPGVKPPDDKHKHGDKKKSGE